jgi:hypothetical protein
MPKRYTAALLFVCAAVSLAAQEVSSGAALLNLNSYASYFGFADGKIKITSRYITSAPIGDSEKFGALGSHAPVDTPLEFALLSYYSQPVVNIRPAEADRILPANDPTLSGKKLGAAVLKELTELKSLDPSNTAAIGRYEGMIKFISDKNGVSRAEIESYYRQGMRPFITEVVTEKLNESRNGYVPAEVYAQWKKIGAGDAQALLVDAITRFYLEPSQANFRGLVEIYARQYELILNGDLFAGTGRDTFRTILHTLSTPLEDKVVLTGLGLNVEVASLDPRYSVFSTPYGGGKQ